MNIEELIQLTSEFYQEVDEINTQNLVTPKRKDFETFIEWYSRGKTFMITTK